MNSSSMRGMPQRNLPIVHRRRLRVRARGSEVGGRILDPTYFANLGNVAREPSAVRTAYMPAG